MGDAKGFEIHESRSSPLNSRVILGPQLVHVASHDSTAVVQSLVSKSCFGDIGPIIQGSLAMLGSFSSCTARHLKRDHSRAAHELAKETRSAETSQTWFGMDPPFLQQALLFDRSKC